MLLERIQQRINSATALPDNRVQFTIDISVTRRGQTIAPQVYGKHDHHDLNYFAELVRTSHRKLTELNASSLYLHDHAKMHPHQRVAPSAHQR